MSRLPYTILKDLGRKCAGDVGGRIKLTTQLATDPRDRWIITMYAAATALGHLSRHSLAVPMDEPTTPEQHLDMMWEVLRPITLSAMGGDEAPFRELLSKCPR